MTTKKKVLIRGPVFTQSGYGTHARSIARWLLEHHNSGKIDLYVGALPWGITSWMLDRNMEDGLIGKLIDLARPLQSQADVTFQIQLPNEWSPNMGLYNVGVSAVVESDKCNPEWISACNAMSAVVVPSQHAKKCLDNTGIVNTKIDVIPEPFIDEIASNKQENLALDFGTKFNFLMFGQLTGNNEHNDRKNTYNTIKWLYEAFMNDQDVGIVLKTNSARNSRIDRQRTLSTINGVLQQIKKDNNGLGPVVHVLHGNMSNAEVAALYRHPQIKALINLTRGEGYGLPILEATASELPVITTGWSGHVDFMNLGKYIKVQYELKQIHSTRVDNKIWMSGARWAEVSKEDFISKVKKFRDKPVIPQEWAKDLAKTIQQKYSYRAIADMYDERFLCIL
jgi:glycosyltransferase involved in cell wall biosynthesis